MSQRKQKPFYRVLTGILVTLTTLVSLQLTPLAAHAEVDVPEDSANITAFAAGVTRNASSAAI